MERFLKIFLLLVEVASDVLQKLLENRYRADNIPEFTIFLQQKQHELFHLCFTKPGHCCSCQMQNGTSFQQQSITRKVFDDMFSVNSRMCGKQLRTHSCKYDVKSGFTLTHVDVTLGTTLLLNFYKATLDRTETDCISNIRNVRNDIFHHSINIDITKNKYCEYWGKVSTSAVRLASCVTQTYRSEIENKIEDLRKRTICDKDILVQRVLLWQENNEERMNAFAEDLQSMHGKLDQVTADIRRIHLTKYSDGPHTSHLSFTPHSEAPMAGPPSSSASYGRHLPSSISAYGEHSPSSSTDYGHHPPSSFVVNEHHSLRSSAGYGQHPPSSSMVNEHHSLSSAANGHLSPSSSADYGQHPLSSSAEYGQQPLSSSVGYWQHPPSSSVGNEHHSLRFSAGYGQHPPSSSMVNEHHPLSSAANGHLSPSSSAYYGQHPLSSSVEYGQHPRSSSVDDRHHSLSSFAGYGQHSLSSPGRYGNSTTSNYGTSIPPTLNIRREMSYEMALTSSMPGTFSGIGMQPGPPVIRPAPSNVGMPMGSPTSPGYEMHPPSSLGASGSYGMSPFSRFGVQPDSNLSGPHTVGEQMSVMGQPNYMGASLPEQEGFLSQQYHRLGEQRMVGLGITVPGAMKQHYSMILDSSFVQASKDGKLNRCDLFQTTHRRICPPLVTTDLDTQDKECSLQVSSTEVKQPIDDQDKKYYQIYNDIEKLRLKGKDEQREAWKYLTLCYIVLKGSSDEYLNKDILEIMGSSIFGSSVTSPANMKSYILELIPKFVENFDSTYTAANVIIVKAVVFSYGSVCPTHLSKLCTADILYEFVLPYCIETDDILIRVDLETLVKHLLEKIQDNPTCVGRYLKKLQQMRGGQIFIAAFNNAWFETELKLSADHMIDFFDGLTEEGKDFAILEEEKTMINVISFPIDKYDNTIFHYIVVRFFESNKFETYIKYFSEKNIITALPNTDGLTPLYLAAYLGRYGVVSCIVSTMRKCDLENQLWDILSNVNDGIELLRDINSKGEVSSKVHIEMPRFNIGTKKDFLDILDILGVSDYDTKHGESDDTSGDLVPKSDKDGDNVSKIVGDKIISLVTDIKKGLYAVKKIPDLVKTIHKATKNKKDK